MPKISVPAPEKRRTLRTYSKRSRSAEDDASTKPTKKQRVNAEVIPGPRIEVPRLPPPAPAHTSNIPKSSILSYFKPCRSSSRTEPSDPLSDSEKLIHTPPSSPPMFRRIRQPRRLRLRPSTAIVSSDANHGKEDREAKLARSGARSSQREGRQLQENAGSKLNEQQESPQAKPSKTSNLRPKPATIQTTINISSKPTFEECKICRMVYNPLHPPDVKYHSQMHAASLRKKSKA